jgi:hypothetical protein
MYPSKNQGRYFKTILLYNHPSMAMLFAFDKSGKSSPAFKQETAASNPLVP